MRQKTILSTEDVAKAVQLYLNSKGLTPETNIGGFFRWKVSAQRNSVEIEVDTVPLVKTKF